MTNAARILLVEDNELNRSLVRSIVARTKHPTLQAVDLVEAVDLARARDVLATEPFDVVLLDMHLPDGSGLALAEELAHTADRPKIIALTASVLPEEQAAALTAGCDAFLAKPYARDDLIKTLADHLSG